MWFVCGWQRKMAVVRQALQDMGSSMSVVVQQIYNVTDLCNDGQLRKLSAQGGGACRNSAGPENIPVNAAVTQPTGQRLVADMSNNDAYGQSIVLQAHNTILLLYCYCYRSHLIMHRPNGLLSDYIVWTIGLTD